MIVMTLVSIPPSYAFLLILTKSVSYVYEGWNFNSGNYLFTIDTK